MTYSLPLKWFMVFLVIGAALFIVSVMGPRE
jgi:hypothetical protein